VLATESTSSLSGGMRAGRQALVLAMAGAVAATGPPPNLVVYLVVYCLVWCLVWCLGVVPGV
jgi:hypothetical protein